MTDIQTAIIDEIQPRFDYRIDPPGLAEDDGLQTAVIISLFTDRRARADDALPGAEDDRRGWWADAYPEVAGDEIGSRLWLLARAKQTDETLNRARDYALEALQWLVEDGVASTVNVTATWVQPGALELQAQVVKPDDAQIDYRFRQAWEAQYAV